MAEVLIYTDGACSGNPGPGGYGVLIVEGNKSRTLAQGYRKTTNNRMELMAVIAGLQAVGPGTQVRVISDSKYVVDAVNKGWAQKWRRNGWKRNRREYAENADLWAQLLELLAGRKVTFSWVRGHAGSAGNERVDRLAVEASQRKSLSVDQAFERGRTISKPPTLFD
jgi:ribonuclease HI